MVAGAAHKFELMRKWDCRAALGSASDPLEGNFRWHSDGKNGIAVIGDAKRSTLQLLVPTLRVQNCAHLKTKIGWSPICEPNFVAGIVIQESVLFQVQLLAVNEKFKHHVSLSVVLPLSFLFSPLSASHFPNFFHFHLGRNWCRLHPSSTHV
jgi:hypothetical protein